MTSYAIDDFDIPSDTIRDVKPFHIFHFQDIDTKEVLKFESANQRYCEIALEHNNIHYKLLYHADKSGKIYFQEQNYKP